jgi:hypothetical protein
MKFEDLKNDSFVKWEATRMFKAWNTFGKVTKLTDDSVVILTYDDLKETILSKGGEAIKDEIKLLTKDEFEDLVKITISKLNARKTEIEIEFKNEVKKIDTIINGMNEAL